MGVFSSTMTESMSGGAGIIKPTTLANLGGVRPKLSFYEGEEIDEEIVVIADNTTEIDRGPSLEDLPDGPEDTTPEDTDDPFDVEDLERFLSKAERCSQIASRQREAVDKLEDLRLRLENLLASDNPTRKQQNAIQREIDSYTRQFEQALADCRAAECWGCT